MTPIDLKNYYESLLILQFHGKPKASAHIGALAGMALLPQTSVQTITFSLAPSSGAFTLFYGALQTASIAWNDPAPTIQTKLRALTGLSTVTVTGSIAGLLLTFTFTGVTPPADMLTLGANTLSPATVVTFTETDVTLPLAVQDAYNLIGPNPAVGVQLDILGKYAGVTRSGVGLNGVPITLNDSDFLSLIKIAVARNSLTSDLASIVGLLYQNFPLEVFIYDHTDMTIDYAVSSVVGSQNLIQLFIVENLLPRPMAVAIRAVIYNPTVSNFFSFRTYANPASPVTATGFNNYTTYNSSSPWLSYAMAIH